MKKKEDKQAIPESPRSGNDASSASSSSASSSSPPPRPRRAGKRPPRENKTKKSGLGVTFFWALLLLSIYWNVHFVLLRRVQVQQQHSHTPHLLLTNPHLLHHEASKDAFMNGGGSLLSRKIQQWKTMPQQQQDQSSSLPVFVSLNLTQELETLVSFQSAEMLLKSAWQGLLQQQQQQQQSSSSWITNKTPSPYRIITNVVPRKRVRKKDYDVDDFTLTTQVTSVGRLDQMLQAYIQWGGPASAAVHLTSWADIHVFLSFIHFKGRILKDIAIHVLLQDVSVSSESSTRHKKSTNSMLR